MIRQEGHPREWDDDALKKMRDVWNRGGWQAVVAAYPHLTRAQLQNRVYGGGGTRSIADLDREEQTARFMRVAGRGGNFDSTGLLDRIICTPRKRAAA